MRLVMTAQLLSKMSEHAGLNHKFGTSFAPMNQVTDDAKSWSYHCFIIGLKYLVETLEWQMTEHRINIVRIAIADDFEGLARVSQQFLIVAEHEVCNKCNKGQNVGVENAF